MGENSKSKIELPSLEKEIIKSSYGPEEVRSMIHKGKGSLSDYSTHLQNNYGSDSLLVEERVIIDNVGLSPWFASKGFYNVKKEIKPKIYDAIEKMREQTNGLIFGNSPDAPFIMVSALAKHNERLTDDDLWYFREIEAIVVIEEQLLQKRD